MSNQSVSQTRFELNEADLPKFWYNINADSPVPPAPVLNPQTKQPVTPDFLSVLFPMALIMQEISSERYIEIPEEVREIYKLYRPTPLIRARRLEKALDTPAHIYYKYEGVSPAGSHKPNTAIPQAFYNKICGHQGADHRNGRRAVGLRPGIGLQPLRYDPGSVYGQGLLQLQALPALDDGDLRRASVRQPFRPHGFWSARCLTQFPDSPGSLGIAISEAVEVAATSGGAKKYSLGSVLNHVLLHQSVIGEEALKQMDMAGEYPDVVMGCVGGGSNFAGIAYPFLRENLLDGHRTRLVAVEPTATPSLTKGVYAFDYGDSAQMAPIVKMHTLGHSFVPPPIHAGGLRYHGMAPSLSALCDGGYVEALAVPQLATFEAAVQFAKTEGLVPAPESAHAIRAAIDEALDAKQKGEKRVILFNLSGHGNFDLTAYQDYLAGKLQDYEYPEEAVHAAMADLPQVVLQ